MKKMRLLALLILAALPFTQISAQNRQMVLYTWEEMFPQEILDEFKKETGIEVVYKTFEYNENMLDDLFISDGGDYDLIIADDYIVEFAIADNLAQKLDKRRLPNLPNINPIYQHQFYDRLDEYTVPYGAGIQTIVYDPERVKLNITGYNDLWDSALKGRLGIISNYRVVNGMALKASGKSYNTESTADIRAAGQKLAALAPNIRLIQDMNLDEALLSGEIDAAVMYTDQVTKSKMKNPNLKVVYPYEGIGFGIMPAFIPSRAPNPNAAHAFLNFILDPRRGAQCFEYLGYYCTYSASEPYISAEYKDYLILPSFGNFEMIQNLSEQEAEDTHVEIWFNFKSLAEK